MQCGFTNAFNRRNQCRNDPSPCCAREFCPLDGGRSPRVPGYGPIVFDGDVEDGHRKETKAVDTMRKQEHRTSSAGPGIAPHDSANGNLIRLALVRYSRSIGTDSSDRTSP